jgi:type I restriction enzyme S subunit
MHELFTRGLRGEAQKQAELGSVPASWDICRLDHLCALSTGTTPSTKREDYYRGNTPFIKTAEIVNNRIRSATTFISEQAIADYSLTIYPQGTVLLAMYGQGKTRGQVALLEIPAATTQNAAAIRPSGRIHSGFLWHYLLSIYERLRGMGSLGHLSHLNLGYLRELPIPVPGLEEQSEIAAILDAVDRKIDLHREKRAVLEELFTSLLHKLMTGEIRAHDMDLSAIAETEEAVSA